MLDEFFSKAEDGAVVDDVCAICYNDGFAHSPYCPMNPRFDDDSVEFDEETDYNWEIETDPDFDFEVEL